MRKSLLRCGHSDCPSSVSSISFQIQNPILDSSTTPGNARTSSISSLLAALKECSRSKDLDKGKHVHKQAIDCGYSSNIYISNSLINMYAKCGSMATARDVFDSMDSHDVISWTALLQGYAESGELHLVMELYDRMEAVPECVIPNTRTFVVVLTTCAALATPEGKTHGGKRRWLAKGRDVHRRADLEGCCDNIFVQNTLVVFYSKCGRIAEARSVFDSMNYRDVISWTALLQGYVDSGDCESALKIYDHMEEISSNRSCSPNSRTYVAALMACSALAARDGKWIEKGKEVYSRAVKRSCDNSYVRNTLIDLFAKSGCMVEARGVFDRIVRRDVVSWTVLMQGYVQSGDCDLALELYDRMQEEAVTNFSCIPNARTYVTAITACGSLAGRTNGNAEKCRSWLEKGKQIHCKAVSDRCCDNIFVQNSLVDMYSKCRSMQLAREVFDKMAFRDVVTWTALLQGYVDSGHCDLALQLFEGLQGSKDDPVPNDRTYVAALAACASSAAEDCQRLKTISSKWLNKGKAIHSQAVTSNCCSLFVENTLINMYSNCGSMPDARTVFDEMNQRDAISYSCIVQGYVDNGENELALEVFAENDDEIVPNSATFVAALSACGNLMDVDGGRGIHARVQRFGLEEEELVMTSLLEFYGRCGEMISAELVFDSSRNGSLSKNIGGWNALIGGFSSKGDTVRVLEVFEELKEQRLEANEVTFTHLLSSCSHAGLTDKGRKYFDAMQSMYGISPNIIHYSCMVDLLCRSDYVEEALKVVKSMPLEANTVIWTGILDACKKRNDPTLAKIAFDSLVRLDEKYDGAYVLLANMYRHS